MGVYPICFHLRMVISVSFSYRRQCERMHIVPPFRYDYGCGYTYESERVAPRHGLFMGYITRFPTRVLLRLFCSVSLSIFLSLSSSPVPEGLLSPSSYFRFSSRSLPSNAQPFFRPHSTICEERAVEKHVFYACSYRLFRYQRTFPRDIQDVPHKK